MRPKPVILIIENAIDITGSLNSALRSSIYLRERYHFIFILPAKSRAASIISRENFEVYELPMVEIRKKALSLLSYGPSLFRNAMKLKKFVRQHKVDLILNNDFYNLLPAAAQYLGLKTPYICYVRFLPSKFPKSLVRLWFSTHLMRADHIIAVSNAVKNQLPLHQKVSVIGNEIPLTSLPLTISDRKLILYPSNFISGKGHEAAVRTIAALSDMLNVWKIRFIGSDMGLQKNRDFKQSIVALATSLGIVNQTEWLDYDGRINDHYLEASIVLNFSESESFSMTCLEAMFFGRPVIATRCGGPEEIIVNNENGILVNIGDISQMSEAVAKLTSNNALREAMGKAAYQHVRTKFSAENTIGKLEELYQSSLLK